MRTSWLEEQEQTSKPQGDISGRRRLSTERRSHRDRTRSPPLWGTRGQEPRRGDWSPARTSRHDRERKSPSIVEAEHHPETPIKVSGTVARSTALPFTTPFNIEIINALCYEKVKMPMVDLHDGTTDPQKHLGVYKV